MAVPLPNEHTLARLLNGLFEKPVEVKKAAAPFDPKPEGPFVLASYVDDKGTTFAVALCDIPGGASLGAFLTMIPVGVAKDAIKEKKVSEGVLDNLKEIFNIAASLFNTSSNLHLKLGPVFCIPPSSPVDFTTFPNRADLEVVVPSYGGGKFTFRSL